MKYLLLILGAALCLSAQVTINAGGPGDQYYSPTTNCTFLGSIATNAPCVAAYSDPTMGPPTTLRYGYAGLPFSYSIPAPNGICDVALTFVEPNKTAAGQRVFSATVQGTATGPIDIFSRVGLKKPYTLSFPGLPVTSGVVSVAFQPSIGNAVVSTLSVTNCRQPLPLLTLNCTTPVVCTYDATMNQWHIELAPTGATIPCAVVDASTIDATWRGSVQLANSEGWQLDCIPQPSTLVAIKDGASVVGILVPWPATTAKLKFDRQDGPEWFGDQVVAGGLTPAELPSSNSFCALAYTDPLIDIANQLRGPIVHVLYYPPIQ